MHFMLAYTFKPELRNQAITRFRVTAGRPPKGVQLLSRWTNADLSGGFALLQSYDIKALVEFCLHWSDLMELEIVPLIEDAQLQEVFERNKPAKANKRRRS
jgi:hypothetical protein